MMMKVAQIVMGQTPRGKEDWASTFVLVGGAGGASRNVTESIYFWYVNKINDG